MLYRDPKCKRTWTRIVFFEVSTLMTSNVSGTIMITSMTCESLTLSYRAKFSFIVPTFDRWVSIPNYTIFIYNQLINFRLINLFQSQYGRLNKNKHALYSYAINGDVYKLVFSYNLRRSINATLYKNFRSWIHALFQVTLTPAMALCPCVFTMYIGAQQMSISQMVYELTIDISSKLNLLILSR